MTTTSYAVLVSLGLLAQQPAASQAAKKDAPTQQKTSAGDLATLKEAANSLYWESYEWAVDKIEAMPKDDVPAPGSENAATIEAYKITKQLAEALDKDQNPKSLNSLSSDSAQVQCARAVQDPGNVGADGVTHIPVHIYLEPGLEQGTERKWIATYPAPCKPLLKPPTP